MIVTLTAAAVDQIKLAVMDVGVNVSLGYSGEKWSSFDENFVGCVTLVTFKTRASTVQAMWDQVKASLKKRNVQYVAIRIENDDIGSIVGGGNLQWKKQEPEQGVYRTPGVVV